MEVDSQTGFDDDFGKDILQEQGNNQLELTQNTSEPKFTKILTESEQHILNLEKKLDKVKQKPKTVIIEEKDNFEDEYDQHETKIPLVDDPDDFFDLNPPIDIPRGMTQKNYDAVEEGSEVKDISSDELKQAQDGWWKWFVKTITCAKDEVQEDYDDF